MRTQTKVASGGVAAAIVTTVAAQVLPGLSEDDRQLVTEATLYLMQAGAVLVPTIGAWLRARKGQTVKVVPKEGN